MIDHEIHNFAIVVLGSSGIKEACFWPFVLQPDAIGAIYVVTHLAHSWGGGREGQVC